MPRWSCDGGCNGGSRCGAAYACHDGCVTGAAMAGRNGGRRMHAAMVVRLGMAGPGAFVSFGHGGPCRQANGQAWAGAMAGAIASIWSLQLCEQLVRCGSCEGGPGQGGCYGEHCGLWVNCLGFGGSCAGHVGPWHVRGMAGPACARHGGPGMCGVWRALACARHGGPACAGYGGPTDINNLGTGRASVCVHRA